MTRKPEEIVRRTGAAVKTQLAAMESATRQPMKRLCFAGGMMMARNIPYRATLSALIALAGRILPTTTPSTVPRHQPETETAVAA